MIRLNLSNRPEWLDLLPGLRVLVAPLTTALMVSARADPAIEQERIAGAEPGRDAGGKRLRRGFGRQGYVAVSAHHGGRVGEPPGPASPQRWPDQPATMASGRAVGSLGPMRCASWL